MSEHPSSTEQRPRGELIEEFHRVILDACPEFSSERELQNGLFVIGRDALEDGDVYAMRTLDITGHPENPLAHRVSYSLDADFQLRKDYLFVSLDNAASRAQAMLDADQLNEKLAPEIAKKVLDIGESTMRAYRLLEIRLQQAKNHESSGDAYVSDQELQAIVHDVKQALSEE